MPNEKVKRLLKAFMGHFQEEEVNIPLALRHEPTEVVFTALLDDPEEGQPVDPSLMDFADLQGEDQIGIADEVDQMVQQAMADPAAAMQMAPPGMMDAGMDMEGMMGPSMAPGPTQERPPEELLPDLGPLR